MPPSCCSKAGCGAPCGAQQMCPQHSALHEPAPARHGQEGDKAEGALAWLGVGNQLSASVLRLALLSTSPCCCQSCTRAAHPSTPAPQHPADPSPVATPSPRHSRPGRQGMDAPVLAPAPWPRAVMWSCPLHSRACSCPGCCCGPHSAPAGSPSPRPPACPRAPAARGCSPAAAVAPWRRVPAGQPRACVPVPCRASCRAQVFLLGDRSY